MLIKPFCWLDLDASELNLLLTPFDLKRLESYANNMVDYHVIIDLLPMLASLYFQKRLGEGVRLSAVQSSILLALGLQRKNIEDVESELQIAVSQGLALLVKIVRKISKCLIDIQKAVIAGELSVDPSDVKSQVLPKPLKPSEVSLEEELNTAGDE
ncbi:hypothetical protein C0993_004160, partial [Termitomyces sp. T159_Od127]